MIFKGKDLHIKINFKTFKNIKNMLKPLRIFQHIVTLYNRF